MSKTMNNLFILHTQYNLILGSGIAKKLAGDKSYLVLYAEFPVTDTILNNLRAVFSDVIVVKDRFSPPAARFAEIKEIKEAIRKTKALERIPFDRIFLSQERRFDTLLAYRCSKRSTPAVIDVEEDAYYSIHPERKPPKKTLKGRFFDILRRITLGKNPYFRTDGIFYGANPIYSEAYLLFPSVARSEMQNKTLREMTGDMLFGGIEALYADKKTKYPDAKKYLLLFFDLMNRYRDKQAILSTTRAVIEAAKEKGYTVLAKYHPRETEKFTDMSALFELEQFMPAEKVLADLKDKELVVFGNATTVCTVAAKLGKRVVSVAKIDHPENTVMHSAMEKMGILLVASAEEATKAFDN